MHYYVVAGWRESFFKDGVSFWKCFSAQFPAWDSFSESGCTWTSQSLKSSAASIKFKLTRTIESSAGILNKNLLIFLLRIAENPTKTCTAVTALQTCKIRMGRRGERRRSRRGDESCGDPNGKLTLRAKTSPPSNGTVTTPNLANDFFPWLVSFDSWRPVSSKSLIWSRKGLHSGNLT